MSEQHRTLGTEPPGSNREDSAVHPEVAIAGFVVSLVAVAICWIPFLGLLGWVGILLGAVPLLVRVGDPRRPQKKTLAYAALVLGFGSSTAGVIWTFLLIYLIQSTSCPHVYSYDGQAYRLDADPLSGSLFRGAESTDLDRLEFLAAVGGEYRLRIANERDERDHVNAVELLVVDHPPQVEVLPTSAGGLAGLTDLRSPLQCTDTQGRDQLALLAEADDLPFVSAASDFSSEADEAPLEILTCVFDFSGGGDAVLLLRAHNSQFAADIFVEYLAEMGPGVGPLLEWTQDAECCSYEDKIAEEIQRLGLPLTILAGDGDTWSDTVVVQPIGPAVFRSTAVPLSLAPRPDGTAVIQLEMSPLLWEVDQIALGLSTPIQSRTLPPISALDPAGLDVTAALTTVDESRLSLDNGALADVVFSAPPLPEAGLQRTVVMQINGYYEFGVGGRAWLNPVAVWKHQTGRNSLPRYALRKAQ